MCKLLLTEFEHKCTYMWVWFNWFCRELLTKTLGVAPCLNQFSSLNVVYLFKIMQGLKICTICGKDTEETALTTFISN